MEEKKYLHFLSKKVREKYTYQNTINKCPFCDVDALQDIINRDGNIILLKNKFTTLKDTFQTVIIETDNCNSDITSYTEAHMKKLISFAIDNWVNIEKTKEYKSVILYKNHGELSGGSIKHAHMQIVGLKEIDYNENINKSSFEGTIIYENMGNVVNLSKTPNINPVEFNIISKTRNDEFLAKNIQNVVSYIINHMKCSSYNLFFYKRDESIICKIVPRYVTSPFYIGYLIPSVSDRSTTIVDEIKKLFY